MDKTQVLRENLVNMRKLMLIKESDDLPYAEEIPEEPENGGDVNIDKVLEEIKADYAKAKTYIDLEASKLMVGTCLLDIVQDENIATSKEQLLENTSEYYEKRCEYYDERIDEFHDKLGYQDSRIDQLRTYSAALYYLAKDMYDAAQVWYRLKEVAETVKELYAGETKRRKTLINIKTTQI